MKVPLRNVRRISSGSSGLDKREQRPLPGQALEHTRSSGFERESRSLCECASGFGYEYLIGSRLAQGASRFVHGDAPDVVADELYFADVHARADCDSLTASQATNVSCAVQRCRRPDERRE